MLYFCTLFDSNYLSRGLALHESLQAQCAEFHLYIVPFDKRCFDILGTLQLKNVTVIPLEELEDRELLAVKPGRTRVEYCWTCTSSAIRYVLRKYGLPHCTYLDADLYFYAPPSALIAEMGDNSVLITGHRYSGQYRYLEAASGIYCVQFITFRNDDRGMKALEWWRDACVEWCYAREEDGKFGDQKYLDDWPVRFEGVHVLQHPGGGVAPWNIQQYALRQNRGSFALRQLSTNEEIQMVFYHFHYVRFYTGGMVDLGDYRIEQTIRDLLYRPYLHRLESAKRRIQAIDQTVDPHGTRQVESTWEERSIKLKRIVKRQYNVYPVQKLIGM